ncbi:MAG TPA: phosphoribosyltransferase family protein [Terriglobales bacterium]|nr:phosphoribosyltransferase family protein [Terriglobales bacterium]
MPLSLTRFADRTEAGRALATRLRHYAERDDVVVLGIPRGGAPVAMEVAAALRAPWDVFLARKLGVPGEEELAFGAVAGGGVRVLDQEIIRQCGLSAATVEEVTERQRRELERREVAFRAGRAAVGLEGKVAILVDDGIATGASMRAAVEALRGHHPARIVVAVPVAPLEARERMAPPADEYVCVHEAAGFAAVGDFYQDFRQVGDAEVQALLARAPRAA